MCVRDWQSKKNPCGLNSPLDQVSHVHQNKTKQTLFLISSDCPVDSRLEQSLSIDVEQVFSLSLFPFIIMYIESIVGRRHWFFSFSPFFCVFRGPPKPFFSFVAERERKDKRRRDTSNIQNSSLLFSLSPLFFLSLLEKMGGVFIIHQYTADEAQASNGRIWERKRNAPPSPPPHGPAMAAVFFPPTQLPLFFPPRGSLLLLFPPIFFFPTRKRRDNGGRKKKHPANKKWGLGKRRQRRCSPIGLTRYPYVAVGVGGCVPFFPSLFSYRPTVVYILFIYF